jgi:hypothetical protein
MTDKQDKQTLTGRKELAEKRLPGQDCHGKAARTGPPEQDCPGRAAKTGLLS